MSRLRIGIVAAVLVIFFAAGGYIIFTNKSSGPKDVTFNVTVTGGTSMKPSELPVHQNDTVTINITSDIDGEVHLHGYDIPFENTAGKVTTHTFKAVNTGDFEIEWEPTSTPLGDLKVSP
jgi:FtsP/CotA-like multicopper oxidase with cupredoxin domain